MLRARVGLRRTATFLGILLSAVAVIVSIAAPPASASAGTCRGAGCFYVHGAGSHVDYVGYYLDSTLCPPQCSITGHLQARWQAGGTNHYKNSSETTISTGSCNDLINLNVWVDAYTYVCGCWWHWNGSSWVLPYGDWQCVKTHP